MMTKQQAADLLGGGKHNKTAELLNITKSAFSMWPDQLTDTQQDRVLGAAIRHGIDPKPVAVAATPDC